MPQGAAYVFAPQKGASPEQVELLDSRLREYGRGESAFVPGAGAAGVLHRCVERGIPVHLLSGQILDAEKLLEAGFASVSDINEGISLSLEECLLPANAMKNLQKTVEKVLQI